jgi:hypothetical protein
MKIHKIITKDILQQSINHNYFTYQKDKLNKIFMTYNEKLTVNQFYIKYKDDINIIELITTANFLTNKQLKQFALFCAKNAISYVDKPNPKVMYCIDVLEKNINNVATDIEVINATNDIRDNLVIYKDNYIDKRSRKAYMNHYAYQTVYQFRNLYKLYNEVSIIYIGNSVKYAVEYATYMNMYIKGDYSEQEKLINEYECQIAKQNEKQKQIDYILNIFD